MRTILLPFLALACADAPDSDQDADALARGDAPLLEDGEHLLNLTCLDEKCSTVQASLVPEAKASWWIGDQHLGDGFEVELDSALLHEEPIRAWLDEDDFVGALLGGHDGETIAMGVTNSHSCEKFWIQAVGGCLTAVGSISIIENQLPTTWFTRSSPTTWTLQTTNARGAWWPGGFTPATEPVLGTLSGLGIVFAIAPGSAVDMRIQHDSTLTYIGEALCTPGGYANVFPP